MSAPFTRVGKQILANGFHYADAADEAAAEHIVARLNGWQPIATVPTDVQLVLLFVPGHVGGFWLGYSDGGPVHVIVDEATAHPGLPTHWMPLPTPPSSSAEEG